nr:MAG TPA: hypothetical protein [Caudoviricetes sp.]
MNTIVIVKDPRCLPGVFCYTGCITAQTRRGRGEMDRRARVAACPAPDLVRGSPLCGMIVGAMKRNSFRKLSVC